MGAKKSRMKKKALALIEFGYRPTFRELMVSYRFWRRVIRRQERFIKKKGKDYGKKNE